MKEGWLTERLWWVCERLNCWRIGHAWVWKRNIHGDEINECGGRRSVWVCWRCQAHQWRRELYVEHERHPGRDA